jgi:hypothetical protein
MSISQSRYCRRFEIIVDKIKIRESLRQCLILRYPFGTFLPTHADFSNVHIICLQPKVSLGMMPVVQIVGSTLVVNVCIIHICLMCGVSISSIYPFSTMADLSAMWTLDQVIYACPPIVKASYIYCIVNNMCPPPCYLVSHPYVLKVEIVIFVHNRVRPCLAVIFASTGIRCMVGKCWMSLYLVYKACIWSIHDKYTGPLIVKSSQRLHYWWCVHAFLLCVQSYICWKVNPPKVNGHIHRSDALRINAHAG